MTFEEFKQTGYYVNMEHKFSTEEIEQLETATTSYFVRRSEIYDRKLCVQLSMLFCYLSILMYTFCSITLNTFSITLDIYNSGIEYDTHLDIEPNSIRTPEFRQRHPPLLDQKKLEEKEKQWKIASGKRFFEIIITLHT
jgi:hypothetical protein